MPVQFWKKAAYGIAVATAATAGPGLPPAIAAPAAPVPAPVALIPVPCGGAALSAAVATAPPDSVLALTPECTYALTRGLPAIADTLGLLGPATITLSEPGVAAKPAHKSAAAKPNGPILTVAAGGNVTTDHVSFAGGDASGDGGAIHNDGGSVQVYFGSFSHNNASARGGAIYNADGLLKVFGATFIGNSARQGGAIENFGTAAITRADFIANTAFGFGGAIENDRAARVDSSSFHGNIAHNGGAAYNQNGTLTVRDSNFTGNQTAFDGATKPRIDENVVTSGAAVASKARMTLKGDSFDSNGDGTTGKGGGVYNDGTATITDSTVSGNRAVAGGGFYNDATATLRGDTIQANSTAHDGGGIYNFDRLTISGIKIHGNHAGLDGGGLLNGGITWITGSQIYLNSAGIGGGGIHDYYRLRLRRTILYGNAPDNCESRRGAADCVRHGRRRERRPAGKSP